MLTPAPTHSRPLSPGLSHSCAVPPQQPRPSTPSPPPANPPCARSCLLPSLPCLRSRSLPSAPPRLMVRFGGMPTWTQRTIEGGRPHAEQTGALDLQLMMSMAISPPHPDCFGRDLCLSRDDGMHKPTSIRLRYVGGSSSDLDTAQSSVDVSLRGSRMLDRGCPALISLPSCKTDLRRRRDHEPRADGCNHEAPEVWPVVSDGDGQRREAVCRSSDAWPGI